MNLYWILMRLVQRLSSLEMKSVTRVQIPDEDV